MIPAPFIGTYHPMRLNSVELGLLSIHRMITQQQKWATTMSQARFASAAADSNNRQNTSSSASCLYHKSTRIKLIKSHSFNKHKWSSTFGIRHPASTAQCGSHMEPPKLSPLFIEQLAFQTRRLHSRRFQHCKGSIKSNRYWNVLSSIAVFHTLKLKDHSLIKMIRYWHHTSFDSVMSGFRVLATHILGVAFLGVAFLSNTSQSIEMGLISTTLLGIHRRPPN